MSSNESFHVAVTGAAGYIGSRVVKLLHQEYPEWDVTVLDNFYLGNVHTIEDIDIQDVDVRDRDHLEDTLKGANLVMHLAAISGVDEADENPEFAYEVNVTGTNNVAWFCRKTGAGLVFPVSMAVIGDPTSFPITVDDPRDPLNWYGRTKVLSERAIEDFADGAFPAHLLLKSNVYGEHTIGTHHVSKNMVVNFFVDRAIAGEPLTVYKPGTQARNWVHVMDVARAYVRSAERMYHQLHQGETGVEKYEIASQEDPSVMEVAELVQQQAAAVLDQEVEVQFVESPRSGETTVDVFDVDISRAETILDWSPEETVENTVRALLEKNKVVQ